MQSNENMELTNAIQSELHVKKELARRMGELQEELHNIKEQVESFIGNYQRDRRQNKMHSREFRIYCTFKHFFMPEPNKIPFVETVDSHLFIGLSWK